MERNIKPTFVLALLIFLSPVCLFNRQIVAASQGSLKVLPVSTLQNAYGSRQSGSGWNSHADLNHDGIINLLDLVLFSRTVPVIVNVTNNLWLGHEAPREQYAVFNVIVLNALQCVLSYRYGTVFPQNDTYYYSEWTNETMVPLQSDYSRGSLYVGSVDTDSVPGGYTTFVSVRIDVMNANYATETTAGFVNWNDP